MILRGMTIVVHRNKLSKEMNRINDESLYGSVNKLFRQLLLRSAQNSLPRDWITTGIVGRICS